MKELNWGKQSKLYIYIQNKILQGNPYHVNDDLNRKMHTSRKSKWIIEQKSLDAPMAFDSEDICLSCHIFCDTGPWFLHSQSRDHPNLVVFKDKLGEMRNQSINSHPELITMGDDSILSHS